MSKTLLRHTLIKNIFDIFVDTNYSNDFETVPSIDLSNSLYFRRYKLHLGIFAVLIFEYIKEYIYSDTYQIR